MKLNLKVYLKDKLMYNNITEYDYERVSHIPNSNHDSFKIVSGRYTGTIVTYGEVAIQEKLDGSDPVLKFQYQIEETPLDADELKDSTEFNTYVGDILQHVLTKALEDNNFAIGDKPDGTEFTDNNSEELS